MEKYIYKITNLLNGKVYIGQAKNYKERFTQHKHLGYGNEKNKKLYQAFKEDGIENFSFKVIEGPIANYNEREKYWISYYHSYIKDPEYGDTKGYNGTVGGEEPPVHYGVDSPFLKHDIQDQEKVKQLLKETNLKMTEIAEKTGYNVSSVQRINYGIIWRDEKIDYPIRKPKITKQDANERALEIIYNLKHTKKTQKQIAEEFGVSRSTVTMINLGKNNKIDELEYPIREIKKLNQIQGKPVLMLDIETEKIIKEFVNCTEAMVFLGKKQKESISACARGIQKTAFGYKWKYKE